MKPLSALATALLIGSAGAQEPKRESGVPPARDGNIAIQQELCAAREVRTSQAYDLFIARHPNHPLAEIARKERAELKEEELR